MPKGRATVPPTILMDCDGGHPEVSALGRSQAVI